MLPKEEELTQVKDYKGDEFLLGDAEYFFYVLIKIPAYQFRIQALQFLDCCQEKLDDLDEKIKTVEKGYEEIKQPEHLKQIFTVVLALGNYLNGTTNKGGAYGFNMDSLRKVAELKSADNKSTLLDYAARIIIQKYEKSLKVFEQVENLRKASKYALKLTGNNPNCCNLTEELQELVKGFQQVQKASDSQSKDPLDQVKSKLQPEVDKNILKLEQMQKKLSDLENQWVTIIKKFGEDPKQPSFEVFSKIDYFLAQLEKSVKKERKMIEIQEKERQKEERRIQEIENKQKQMGVPTITQKKALQRELTVTLEQRRQAKSKFQIQK